MEKDNPKRLVFRESANIFDVVLTELILQSAGVVKVRWQARDSFSSCGAPGDFEKVKPNREIMVGSALQI
jgi:hypothetical protein